MNQGISMLTSTTFRRFALACLLALGGCATGNCDVEKWAELPLLPGRALPLVQISVNGRPAAMVLDSGAQRSMLAAASAARLGVVATGRERAVTMAGIGGNTVNRETRVADFVFGSIRARDMSVMVAPLTLPVIDGIPVDGLLGADVLAPLDVELDLPHRRVAFYKQRTCAAGPPWSEPYATLSAKRGLDNTVVIPAVLDGQPQRAMLDTGTMLSTVSLDAALRGGVDEMALRRDPVVAIHGANQGLSSHRLHKFAELGIGQDAVPAPVVVVTDAAGAAAARSWDMLIGNDYIGRKKLWLSYATDQVFVAPPVGAVVPR